jgi:putative NIF3 family GTP cyclohydrolase 1 type 2
MELRDLVSRLGQLFRPEAFDERDGWDFTFGPGEMEALLARATPAFAASFNGLLLDPSPTDAPPASVGRAYLMVFPEPALLDRVLAAERERGDGGALILTHHVADATEAAGFAAIPTGRLDELRAAGVALYVLHAPLDCHPDISTSGALADGLGLRRVGMFAPYHGGHAGVLAETAGESEPFGAFAERVRALCELPRLNAGQVRHAGRPVRRVAIVAGGGDDVDMLGEAEALGADTYLTGTWWTPQAGEWADGNRERLRAALPGCGMNLLGASHDASELVVLRDRVAPLLAGWGISVEVLRRDDHWR